MTELLYVIVTLSSSLHGHLGKEVVGLQTASLSSFNCIRRLRMRAMVSDLSWQYGTIYQLSLVACVSFAQSLLEDLDLVTAYISEYASACCSCMTPEKGTWGPLVTRDGITCLRVLVSCQTFFLTTEGGSEECLDWVLRNCSLGG